MDITSSLVIVAIAGLIHASFQLSVSMLTLLSSHTVGKKRSLGRLVLLTNSFALGAGLMTLLLLSTLSLVFSYIISASTSPDILLWTIACGLLAGVGISVWVFYYRKEAGTSLWIPRGVARYLSERTKATKNSAEAFGLGLSSVVGELLFIIAPIVIAALILINLEPFWQAMGIALYTFVSLGSLLIVNGLIGSGHSLARIQKWREENKTFLQFAAGSGLLVLAFYAYVGQVVEVTAIAAAGSV
ncbi:MAG TPA: hypothetical protein VGE34_03535 [Candidatus Saccharimonadales bacterium]